MKTIDVYIEKKEKLVEIYNKECVSTSLIDYLVNKTMYISNKDDLELKLYVTEATKGCSELVKKGLEEEYQRSLKRKNITNVKQTGLLLVGFLILLTSTLISDNNIFHEVIIIAGWVPIWEAVELELLTDTKEKRRRKILRKLIKSDIRELLENNDK